MRQNITIATMRAIQKAKDLYFFCSMRRAHNTIARAGYMSKDGNVAWFWVKEFYTDTYKIYIFHRDGVVYPATGGTNAGIDHEASEQCRLRCLAYDRDRTLVNATAFTLPKEVPRNNRRDYEPQHN